ncbi:MAG: nucleoside-diphosphate sugar epimerase/dehydratase [Candidatus Sericytochromatia bacterium]
MAFRNIFPFFRIAQVTIDIVLTLAVYIAVFIIRFEGSIPNAHLNQFWFFLPILPIIRIVTNTFMGLYYHLWKYFGMREMMSVFYSTCLGSGIFILTAYLTNNSSFPRSIFVFEWALMFIAFFAVRSSRRFSHEVIKVSKKDKKRVLIIGAGDAGQLLVNEMQKNKDNSYMPVGFIDDDISKIKAKINGIKVFGNRNVIPKVVSDWDIDTIIISIPSAKSKVIKDILDICTKTKAEIKIVPTIREILDGDVKVNSIREIRIEDLLGREPIKIDDSALQVLFKGQKILITGAGGSIGSELCKQLAKFKPSMMILLGHGENSIFKINSELNVLYPDLNVVKIIADIKDKNLLDKVFDTFRPNFVFHAAAHKHVPLMEENICEAMINNVFGTKNLVECADKYKVKKFVNISTDKAVSPTSIMGTSKRLAELIVKYYNQNSETAFVSVRFGNVIGSRGSVIPIFQEQINKGGPVTVTHPEMTRYFMTIPEAVQLVMQSSYIGKGSEVFVLNMGEPIKIVDLAINMIKLSGFTEKDIPISFTGMREGEKLHESLFMENEEISETLHDKIRLSTSKNYDEKVIYDINILIEKAKIFDYEEINKILEKIIPSYQKREIFLGKKNMVN